MDWSKAKNWLILLFLSLNIFLIIKLVAISNHSSTVDKDVIKKTVSILNSNGINVSESQIPNKIPKLNSVEVTNNIPNKDEFAKLLLGDGLEKDENLYKKGNVSLEFSKNHFSYTNPHPSGEFPFNEAFLSINSENAIVLVSDFLTKLNLSTDSAISSLREQNDVYIVTFNQKLDKYPLFDSYITVNVSKNGILSVDGNWFSASSDQSTVTTAATRITPSTSALIDFISASDKSENELVEIADISLGYTSGDDSEYHANAVAIPVWQIKTSNNEYYYFDAR